MDLCLYYRWDSQIEVIVWLSLIVNILVICDKLGMDTTKAEQMKYHSVAGKLLYLVKWSCPEITNSVHKLNDTVIAGLYDGSSTCYAVCSQISGVWSGHAARWSLGWVQRFQI